MIWLQAIYLEKQEMREVNVDIHPKVELMTAPWYTNIRSIRKKYDKNNLYHMKYLPSDELITKYTKTPPVCRRSNFLTNTNLCNMRASDTLKLNISIKLPIHPLVSRLTRGTVKTSYCFRIDRIIYLFPDPKIR